MPSAYLLISHGSRDRRPQFAVDQLARLLRQKVQSPPSEVPTDTPEFSLSSERLSKSATTGRLAAPLLWEPLVGTACLELSPVPLHEQIKQFGNRASATGCNVLEILPLFLLSGVHVMEDIPKQVAQAKQSLGQDITIELKPHLGAHPGLSRLLANQMAAVEAVERLPRRWILLAHGSSRAGSTQSVEALAAELGAVEAYWAVPPDLEMRVQELVSSGDVNIGILPYFLFSGGITDAIAQSVEQIQERFPTASLQLVEPLGACAELANLIWDLTA